jgi:hypothetical protein
VGPGASKNPKRRPCTVAAAGVYSSSELHFRSASLMGGVLAQLSIPDGAEVASSSVGDGCSAEVDHKLRRKGKEVAKPGSNGSAVVSGKGEEKRAEKADRFGVVRCQRLVCKDSRGIVALQQSCRPTTETREGCSTLAVVSTGSGKVHANCGNGGGPASCNGTLKRNPRPRRTGHLEGVTQPATANQKLASAGKPARGG